MRSLKGYTKPEAAARRMCVLAREKREYGGAALDDISAIVLDIGPRHGGSLTTPTPSTLILLLFFLLLLLLLRLLRAPVSFTQDESLRSNLGSYAYCE